MIFYISIAVILFGISIVILASCFNWCLDDWIVNTIIAVLVIAFVFVSLRPVLHSEDKDRCIEAQQTYEELLLYKDVAEASNSEALRYNYYQKVAEWNRGYYFAAEQSANETFLYWWGPYWCNIYYGTGPIEFELRDG